MKEPSEKFDYQFETLISKIKSMSERAVLNLWEKKKHGVFWDRNVAYKDWHAGVKAAKPNYISNTLEMMELYVFVALYGVDNFKQDWPKIHDNLLDKNKFNAGRFNVLWRYLIAKNQNLIIKKEFCELPKKTKEVLMCINQQPGITPYKISQCLSMDYKNVSQHVKKLVELEMLNVKQTIENGRTQKQLFSYN